jgi:hypothetical protein
MLTQSMVKQISQFAAWSGIAVSAIWLSIAPARAGSFEDARGGMSKAYNDYYRALQSKPNATPEERARMSQQILAPAEKNMSNTLREETRKTIQQASQHGYSLGQGVDPKRFAPPPKGAKAAKAVSASQYEPASQPPTPAAAVSRPEEAIDGHNVPRELEFSGPKKKSKPAPEQGSSASQH